MKSKFLTFTIFSILLFLPKILWAECILPTEVLPMLQTYDKNINKDNIEFQCKLDINVNKKGMDEIVTTTKSDNLKSKFVSIPTRTDFTLYYSSKANKHPRQLIEFMLIKQNNLYEGDTVTKRSYDFIYSSKSLTGVSVRSSVLNNNPMATTHFWLIAKTQKSQSTYIIQKLEIHVHSRGSIEMTVK